MSFKEKFISKQKDLENFGLYPAFPKIIKIDTCNVCNFSCVFCPDAKHAKKCGTIDEKLCYKILEDAYRGGVKHLCLSMNGEPLINKHVEDYARFAKKLGYEYVFLNTNGYLCDEERGIALMQAGVDSIKFSINANKQLYALVHGVDAFDKVVTNLKSLFNNRNKLALNCKIYVSYVAIKQTLDCIEEVKNIVKDFCDDFIWMHANNRAGSMSELDDGIFSGLDDFSFTYPCSQPFNNIYVSAEGYMIVCCQDFENKTIVADLNKQNIVDAWTNENFTNFRKRYMTKDFDGTPCKNCLFNQNEQTLPLCKEFATCTYQDDANKKQKLDERIAKLCAYKA